MASSLLNYSLNLEVGNTYTFNTIAPAILQATYTNAVLIAKGNYTLATSYSNVNALHINIYPVLINQPNGTSIYPNNPQAYEYYVFQLPSNLIVVLQSSWIIGNSIQLVTGLTLTINVNNLGGYSDVTRILNAISTLGYTNINSNVTNYVSSASSATTTTTSSTQSAST